MMEEHAVKLPNFISSVQRIGQLLYGCNNSAIAFNV